MDTKIPDGRSEIRTTYPKHDEILAALAVCRPARRMGNTIVVSTDVLLPTSVTCTVVLEGGATGTEITASDAGAALACVREVGLEITGSVQRAAARAVQPYGLSLEHGVLRSHPEAISEARYLVLCMANAMAAAATAALMAAKKHEKVRFREQVQQDLATIFSDERVKKNGTLKGFSQETHRFDFVIDFQGGGKLALDVPLPDVTSIASVVLRQADMRAARQSEIRQAITYDGLDAAWKSSDLAQLQLAGVPLVNSENMRRSLMELVH